MFDEFLTNHGRFFKVSFGGSINYWKIRYNLATYLFSEVEYVTLRN